MGWNWTPFNLYDKKKGSLDLKVFGKCKYLIKLCRYLIPLTRLIFTFNVYRKHRSQQRSYPLLPKIYTLPFSKIKVILSQTLKSVKWHNYFGRLVAVSIRLNTHLPYHPVILLLSIQPRKMECKYPRPEAVTPCTPLSTQRSFMGAGSLAHCWARLVR